MVGTAHAGLPSNDSVFVRQLHGGWLPKFRGLSRIAPVGISPGTVVRFPRVNLTTTASPNRDWRCRDPHLENRTAAHDYTGCGVGSCACGEAT